jgi:hypothetical protein
MKEREGVVELIRHALATRRREAIERALAAARAYLEQNPQDWQIAAACEPLYIVSTSLDDSSVN